MAANETVDKRFVPSIFSVTAAHPYRLATGKLFLSVTAAMSLLYFMSGRATNAQRKGCFLYY